MLELYAIYFLDNEEGEPVRDTTYGVFDDLESASKELAYRMSIVERTYKVDKYSTYANGFISECVIEYSKGTRTFYIVKFVQTS